MNRRRLSRRRVIVRNKFCNEHYAIILTSSIAILSLIISLILGIANIRSQYLINKQNTGLDIKNRYYEEITENMMLVRKSLSSKNQRIDYQMYKEEEISELINRKFLGIETWEEILFSYEKAKPFIEDKYNEEIEEKIYDVLFTIDRLYEVLRHLDIEENELKEKDEEYLKNSIIELDAFLMYYYEISGHVNKEPGVWDSKNIYELEEYLYQSKDNYIKKKLKPIIEEKNVEKLQTEFRNMEIILFDDALYYYSSICSDLLVLNDEIASSWFY